MTPYTRFARRSGAIAAAAMLALLPFAAQATDEHFLSGNAAIGGYDPVAYHVQKAPALGHAQYAADYQGVTWHFSSAANRDLFKASPAKYAPAYGGWCSAGASKGKKVPTKPAEFWAVVDGQLYLNSSAAAHKRLFLADTQTVIRQGEVNWKTIYATPAGQL